MAKKDITYGFYDAPFGKMVIGKSEKGLCWLGFMVQGYKGNGLSRMKEFFRGSNFTHNDEAVQELAREIISKWAQGKESEIALDLEGTEFQVSVWQALLKIPKGRTCAYQDIANDIGKPKAVRAVGTAIGENPVSLVIPCHRVLQKSGGLGNYGWGVDMKREILGKESAA